MSTVMAPVKAGGSIHRNVRITVEGLSLPGDLSIPVEPGGVVLFAHGSGSSRHSPRNQYVARVLRDAGLGTLLFDLLTPEEEDADRETRHLRFDIGLLSHRLSAAAAWCADEAVTMSLPAGFFGASTGGAAALVAAAEPGSTVRSIVLRGGRPDLAGESLGRVRAPTLFIVGGNDEWVLERNIEACEKLTCEKQLAIIPGATHLFEEPGALEEVAHHAAAWFSRTLAKGADR